MGPLPNEPSPNYIQATTGPVPGAGTDHAGFESMDVVQKVADEYRQILADEGEVEAMDFMSRLSDAQYDSVVGLLLNQDEATLPSDLQQLIADYKEAASQGLEDRLYFLGNLTKEQHEALTDYLLPQEDDISVAEEPEAEDLGELEETKQAKKPSVLARIVRSVARIVSVTVLIVATLPLSAPLLLKACERRKIDWKATGQWLTGEKL